MTDAKVEAAQTMAEMLLKAEASVAEALTNVADLVAFMPRARAVAGLAHGAGHAAVSEGTGVLSQLSQAQGGLDAMHKKVAAIGKLVGVDVSATGPFVKEPEEAGFLSVVPSQAA